MIHFQLQYCPQADARVAELQESLAEAMQELEQKALAERKLSTRIETLEVEITAFVTANNELEQAAQVGRKHAARVLILEAEVSALESAKVRRPQRTPFFVCVRSFQGQSIALCFANRAKHVNALYGLLMSAGISPAATCEQGAALA